MHSYSMTLREFGQTPTRDLLMLFEDIPRIQATEALLQMQAVLAGTHPLSASLITDRWESIIDNDPEDTEPPPKITEAEYAMQQAMLGFKEIVVGEVHGRA